MRIISLRTYNLGPRQAASSDISVARLAYHGTPLFIYANTRRFQARRAISGADDATYYSFLHLLPS